MYVPIRELNTDWILDANKIFSFFLHVIMVL